MEVSLIKATAPRCQPPKQNQGKKRAKGRSSPKQKGQPKKKDSPSTGTGPNRTGKPADSYCYRYKPAIHRPCLVPTHSHQPLIHL